MKNIRRCPRCGKDSYVIDSRLSGRGLIIRRRSCEACGSRWSTAEIPYTVALKLYDMMDLLKNEKELYR